MTLSTYVGNRTCSVCGYQTDQYYYNYRFQCSEGHWAANIHSANYNVCNPGRNKNCSETFEAEHMESTTCDYQVTSECTKCEDGKMQCQKCEGAGRQQCSRCGGDKLAEVTLNCKAHNSNRSHYYCNSCSKNDCEQYH